LFKKIAYTSAVAIALLVAPTTKMYAGTTPSIVTGGDPQPTGEDALIVLSIIPSLAVL
jgi:hypothetical protein